MPAPAPPSTHDTALVDDCRLTDFAADLRCHARRQKAALTAFNAIPQRGWRRAPCRRGPAQVRFNPETELKKRLLVNSQGPANSERSNGTGAKSKHSLG